MQLQDIATKFFEHFARIAWAINNKGLWNEQDGFYYDVLRMPDGRSLPVRVRSIVGLIPLFAVTTLGDATLQRLPHFAPERMRWFVEHRPDQAPGSRNVTMVDDELDRLMSVAARHRLRRILGMMLDEQEFLSPFGVRSVSRQPPRAPVHVRRRRHDGPAGPRAGGVAVRPVRGQLELPWARLVSDQLPHHRGAAPLLRLHRGRLPRRVPVLPRRQRRRARSIALVGGLVVDAGWPR